MIVRENHREKKSKEWGGERERKKKSEAGRDSRNEKK